MFATLVTFFAGLAILTVGGELLVRGASRLAATVGISSLVIGLTVVAFGTSAPEMAVSTISALKGDADIAIGNVVGSNIFNILFILGACALILPLAISPQIVARDLPLMLAASFSVALVGWDGVVSRGEGILLFSGILVYTTLLIVQSRRASRTQRAAAIHLAATSIHVTDEELAAQPATSSSHLPNLGFIVVGLVALVFGSQLLVEAAVTLAKSLGISELVIGLTIVAAGTSLPEVATSIIAAIKGERDIAVGNVIGSSIFNILSVLGLSSAIAPNGVPVSPQAFAVDIPVMIAVALICVPFFAPSHTIGRAKGIFFLAAYGLYTSYLVLGSQQSESLPGFIAITTTVVAPAAAAFVLWLWVQDFRARRTSAA